MALSKQIDDGGWVSAKSRAALVATVTLISQHCRTLHQFKFFRPQVRDCRSLPPLSLSPPLPPPPPLAPILADLLLLGIHARAQALALILKIDLTLSCTLVVTSLSFTFLRLLNFISNLLLVRFRILEVLKS